MNTKLPPAPVPIWPPDLDLTNLYREDLPLNYEEISAYEIAKYKAENQAKEQAEPPKDS